MVRVRWFRVDLGWVWLVLGGYVGLHNLYEDILWLWGWFFSAGG